MNQQRLADHRLRNDFHSLALLGGMATLLATLGFLLLGTLGLVLAVGLVLLTAGLGRGLNIDWVMRLQKARPLSYGEAPRLYDIIYQLSRRAGLSSAPTLYRIQSSEINAFAAGTDRRAGIAITDGLLQRLDKREIIGVVAHEISHVRNRDLGIMALATMMSRLTSNFAFVGQLLLILTLPLTLSGAVPVSWTAILLLVLAPTIASVLQLALSRTREFAADLSAAQLTGDPEGLALALKRLESPRNLWEQLLMTYRRALAPPWLRTHPPTEERIRRLAELNGRPVPSATHRATPPATQRPAVRRPVTARPTVSPVFHRPIFHRPRRVYRSGVPLARISAT